MNTDLSRSLWGLPVPDDLPDGPDRDYALLARACRYAAASKIQLATTTGLQTPQSVPVTNPNEATQQDLLDRVGALEVIATPLRYRQQWPSRAYIGVNVYDHDTIEPPLTLATTPAANRAHHSPDGLPTPLAITCRRSVLRAFNGIVTVRSLHTETPLRALRDPGRQLEAWLFSLLRNDPFNVERFASMFTPAAYTASCWWRLTGRTAPHGLPHY